MPKNFGNSKKSSNFAAAFEKKQCTNTFAMIAQLVEHDLAKVGVASSSLVHRSMKMQDPVLHLFSKKSNPIRETSTRNQRSVSKSKRRKCEPSNLDGVEILLGEPLPTKPRWRNW